MPAPPDLLAAARLSPSTARDVFRAVLDALAQPGRPYRLPVSFSDELPPAVVPALALTDLEVRVGLVGPEPDTARWADVVRTVTGASVAPPSSADWLVGLTPPDPEVVAQLPVGSAMSPESGARLAVACDAIVELDANANANADADGGGEAAPETGASIAVTGPGVPQAGRALRLIGVPSELVNALVDKNRDFPAGIDTWFCARDGTVVGFPRSTQITVADDRRPQGVH